MKTCKKCNIEQDLDNFYTHKNMKDGHLNECKACFNSRVKPNSPEYMKSYYNKNKNKWKDCWWRNREKNLERSRKWKKENKDKVNELNRKRRELKIVSDYKFSIEEGESIKLIFQNKCFRCGSTKRLCLDHHYPLSKGYQLQKYNCVLLCSSCNSQKKDKLPEEFYTLDELISIALIWSNF